MLSVDRHKVLNTIQKVYFSTLSNDGLEVPGSWWDVLLVQGIFEHIRESFPLSTQSILPMTKLGIDCPVWEHGVCLVSDVTCPAWHKV